MDIRLIKSRFLLQGYQFFQLRYLFISILLLLQLLLVATRVNASDVFSIYNIHIKTTGKNAVLAKEKAHEEAQRKALERLYIRIVPYAYLENIPEIDIAILPNLIKNFSVENEIFSSVNYKADFVIHFNQEIVEDFLRQSNIPYKVVQSSTSILLPVYLNSNKEVNFSVQNNWFVTWENIVKEAKLVPLRIPSTKDIQANLPLLQKGVSIDSLTLNKLQQYYKNDNIIVVLMDLQDDNNTLFTIHMIGHNATGEINYSRSFTITPDMDVESTLLHASRIFLKVLEYRWQKLNLQNDENTIVQDLEQTPNKATSNQKSFNRKNVFEIIVKFSNYRRWLKIRDILIQNFGEENFDIKALSAKNTHIQIKTDLTLQNLIKHLSALNLYAKKNEGFLVID